MSVFIKYVENCTGKIKEFENRQDANNFMAKIALRHCEDSWVEIVFEGSLLETGPYLEVTTLEQEQSEGMGCDQI